MQRLLYLIDTLCVKNYRFVFFTNKGKGSILSGRLPAKGILLAGKTLWEGEWQRDGGLYRFFAGL